MSQNHCLFLLVMCCAFVTACTDRTPAPKVVPFESAAVIRQVRLPFRPTVDGAGFESMQANAKVVVQDGRLRWFGREQSAPIELETISIGRSVRATRTPRTSGRASLSEDKVVALVHDEGVERLRGVDQGIHQTFRFEKLPRGTGPLEVRIRVGQATYTGQTVLGHHYAAQTTGFNEEPGERDRIEEVATESWCTSDNSRPPTETVPSTIFPGPTKLALPLGEATRAFTMGFLGAKETTRECLGLVELIP